MDDPVTPEEKSARFKRLCDLQESIAAKRCSSMVGTLQRVLVEEKNSKTGLLTGRTEGNIVVDFEGSDQLIGSFATVEITTARNWILGGVLRED